MLNPLCLALSPLALVFLVGYSYTKRFTWRRTGSSASPTASPPPAAGSPSAAAFEPPALVLWFALTVWIAGFDLIYACQDIDIDRAAGAALLPRPLRRRRGADHGAR